jgi:hypothetical protein
MKLPTALILFPLALGAVEVELDFTITSTVLKPSTATATYRIGTNFNVPSTIKTYTGPVVYTGNIVASAEIETGTGNMDSIEFTGGAISTSDILTTLNPIVGSVPYTAIFSTNGIKRSPRSDAADPLTGGFPNGTLHYTEFTEGSFTATNYISAFPAFDVVNVTVPLADFRPYLIGSDVFFPVAIGIDQAASTPLESGFVASLHSLINLAPVFPPSYINGAGLQANQYFTHDYKETGNIYAEASYSVPTDYGQWALDNGLELTTGEELNQAGMPYSLLYAFDLPPDAASLPMTFSSSPDPTVTLDLPSSGLGFTVEVEYSSDLATGFSPLPDENFEDGTDSLDAGKQDDATLSYPDGGKGFLRFYVDLDPES